MRERDLPPTHLSRRDFVAVSTFTAIALQLANPTEAAQASVERGEVAAESASSVTLRVNGTNRTITVEPRVTLLDALRDHLGLTGTKKGCDQGTCGACTVLVAGRRIDSCLTLAVMHAGDEITTIEGIARDGQLHPVQAAFIKYDGFQCGYCTSGQIVSAIGLLAEQHALNRETVSEQLSGNICRCGCYPHIVDAVLEAGQTL